MKPRGGIFEEARQGMYRVTKKGTGTMTDMYDDSVYEERAKRLKERNVLKEMQDELEKKYDDYKLEKDPDLILTRKLAEVYGVFLTKSKTFQEKVYERDIRYRITDQDMLIKGHSNIINDSGELKIHSSFIKDKDSTLYLPQEFRNSVEISPGCFTLYFSNDSHPKMYQQELAHKTAEEALKQNALNYDSNFVLIEDTHINSNNESYMVTIEGTPFIKIDDRDKKLLFAIDDYCHDMDFVKAMRAKFSPGNATDSENTTQQAGGIENIVKFFPEDFPRYFRYKKEPNQKEMLKIIFPLLKEKKIPENTEMIIEETLIVEDCVDIVKEITRDMIVAEKNE